MPRLGRLHIIGGYYHVMGRGLEATQARCLAWAVMSNYYHLLIQVNAIITLFCSSNDKPKIFKGIIIAHWQLVEFLPPSFLRTLNLNNL